MSERLFKPCALAAAVLIHIFIIFFISFDIKNSIKSNGDEIRIIRLVNIQEPLPIEITPEAKPETPRESRQEIPRRREIGDATGENPVARNSQAVGTLNVLSSDNSTSAATNFTLPLFDDDAIRDEIVYPRVARRLGVKGRVIVKLEVDSAGVIKNVTVVSEQPEGRGFGEAAIKVFIGKKGIPAYENGKPVPFQFNYTVNFTLK